MEIACCEHSRFLADSVERVNQPGLQLHTAESSALKMSKYHHMVVLSVLGNVAEKLPVLFVVPDVRLYAAINQTHDGQHRGKRRPGHPQGSKRGGQVLLRNKSAQKAFPTW